MPLRRFKETNAPNNGPSYTPEDVCAASALLHNGLQTGLDALGMIPGAGTVLKVLQIGAAFGSAGLAMFGESTPTDAALAGGGLGITAVDTGKVMTTGAKAVPIVGNLLSMGATLNDVYGKNGMANYYDACLAGKN